MTNLEVSINNSLIDLGLGGIGPTWVAVNPALDVLIFSQGGIGVADGNAIPSESLLNRYAVLLDSVNPVTVPKYFLADFSTSLLKELKLAGNQNKRYSIACDFDGATATEPQLEAWDSSAMNSYLSPALGGGAPSMSWYKAKQTTSGLPGVDWVGTPLAGNGVSNILLLNNGSGGLSGAGTLYFNFKIVIPGGYLIPALHTPTLAIVYTTN